MNEENKGEVVKKDEQKFARYAWVVALILAAVIIGLLFYKQKIIRDVTRDVAVEKNFTDGWKTFDISKFGFSFKIPQEWTVTEDNDIYKIYDDKKTETNLINIRISDKRSLDSKEDSDAIQISIPFDKRNYLIMSTGTANDKKLYFYNIASTIEKK